MKNLLIRSASGAIYVGLIVTSLILHELAFSLVLLFFNLVALYEFYRFSKINRSISLVNSVLSLAVFMVHSLATTGIIELKWIWLIVLLPIIVSAFILFSSHSNPDLKISKSLLGILYITAPLILLNHLNIEKSREVQNWLILIVFILIWINDTFAYLSGMMFGKNKLFERITPKKTWEGFIGGVISTMVAAWFFFPVVNMENRLGWLALSFLIAVMAVIGDFVESMFKRNAGIKDSGKIIPGHGGILDRIDSVLFVFPVVFVYTQMA